VNGTGSAGLAARLAVDRGRLLDHFLQAARALRRGGDPAAAHDVRVALRRLEAALDLWRSSLPRRRRRRAARALGRLRRAVGPVREARMTADLFERRLASLSPADRAVAEEIARYARRRLGKVERRWAGSFARRRVERVRARYEDAWPSGGRRGAPGPAWLEQACDRVARRRSLAGEALRGGVALGTDEALHAARVAVKRWRYASERLAAVVPATDASSHDWLKSVQRALGFVSDLHVLRAQVLRWARKHGGTAARPGEREPWAGLLEGIAADRAAHLEDLRRLLTAPGGDPACAPPSPGARAGTQSPV
jgi:CHAD domain-containing protein